MLARREPLARAWADVRRHSPTLGTREAAANLGVSEAELVASACGQGATRLVPAWGPLLGDLPALGPVVATTRSGRALIEKRGTYGNVFVAGAQGFVLNGAIDLRLALEHWYVAFALDDGRRRGLQFFGPDGAAVHKLALDAGADGAAYDAFVERYRAPDQSPQQVVRQLGVRPVPRPDGAVDLLHLRASWASLRDAYDFAQLLETHAISRLQALRLAGPDFARPVATGSVARVLHAVAAAATPIMVFVGNAGTVQNHAGPIKNVYTTGRWLNVRDFAFNLQLRHDRIASAWVVRKPSLDGDVTSLELFDAAGQDLALLFGEREPGIPEPEPWRILLKLVGTRSVPAR